MGENKVRCFELGTVADDGVTGFTGYITAVKIYLMGPTLYELTSRVGEDGKYVEGVWVDQRRISPSVELIPKPVPGVLFNLGAEVEDLFSGFTGVVTGYMASLHGGWKLQISPWVDGKNGYGTPHWFNHARLALVSLRDEG
jgi:hypothetical protein